MADKNIIKKCGIPVYMQVAGILREEIRHSLFQPGDKLSQRKIADRFNVSKKTISDAFAVLQSEGLLSIQKKTGTFINGGVLLSLLEEKTPDWNEYIKLGKQLASENDVYSIYNTISSNPRVHISGPILSKDFNYHKPIKKALERVITRMDETDDFNNINIMGMPSLRQSIAKHMSRYGVSCSMDDIMVTAGPVESLTITFISLLRYGMKLIYENPSLLNSMTFAQTLGANMVGIPMNHDGMDIDRLIDSIRRSNNDSILHISPVNQYPSGFSLSKKNRDAIMAACCAKNTPIIEYDMLRDFYTGRQHPKPLKSFDRSGQVIYIGAFLNTHLTMKISWIIAPRLVLKRLSDVKTQLEICTNTIVQMTADEMLRSGAYYEYLDEYRSIFKERFAITIMLFERYFKGIAEWNPNNDSYYQWLRFKEPINTLKVFKNLNKIAVLPGYFFDKTDTSHIYISPLADTLDNLTTGLREISAAVTKLYNINLP